MTTPDPTAAPRPPDPPSADSQPTVSRPGTSDPEAEPTEAESTDSVEPGRGEYAHLAPLFDRLAATDPDDPEHARLRDELVTGHLPLAEHIARRFTGRGEIQEDLTQVATVGLVNAVDRFDPARGTDFLSYAVPTIMGEVRRYFRDASWAVRVPRRLKELHQSILTATGALSQELGRAPTPRELAEYLRISRDEVFEGLEAITAYRSASLDDLLTEDNSLPLSETIGEEDSGLELVEQREALQPLLARLPHRERSIVLLRFYANLTQTQIADRIGVSQMHVSRLLNRTLDRLRADLSDS